MCTEELTKAELLVMKCIWDASKEMVLSEIMFMANERYKRDWRPQTVSTYLAHLVQKGFLKMNRNGKTYRYQPLILEKEYFDHCFNNFIDFWGINSVVDFMNDYTNKDKEPSCD